MWLYAYSLDFHGSGYNWYVPLRHVQEGLMGTYDEDTKKFSYPANISPCSKSRY
jgi:hypothetical protein